MKLFVLIPAFNEEENIGKVIQNIPRQISGIEQVYVIVINDGSSDNTTDVAINAGADRVITHKTNKGVGAAFMTGIRNSISNDADIVVAIDADAQFDPSIIPELISPIQSNQLDVVIGSRFLLYNPKGIPKIKLFGNKIFTKIISSAIGQKFTDTQTGFRAYSRDALLNVSIVNDFTYTHEVLIDLKFKGLRIGEVGVPVTYFKDRKSRVVKNLFSYSYRAISIILKTLVYHRPILAFSLFGFFLIGMGGFAKWITITKILGFQISAGLSTGLIVLGIVSIMLGLFASVVFKRQSFSEKDLRHYIEEMNKDKKLD